MSAKRASRRRPARRADDATVLEVGPVGLIVVLLLFGALAAGGWWLARGRAAVPPTASGPGAEGVAHAPGTGVTPDGDPMLGRPDAPVTIVEFSDYMCPNCKTFAHEALPWMRGSWIADGFVKLVFRDFAIRGDDATRAAEAAHCAGEQGRYWEMHDRLFAAQGQDGAFERAGLIGLAREAGLDAEALAACLDAGRHRSKVEASTAFARAQGFEGTPTFLVNGRETRGAIPIADWEQLFQLFAQDFARATQGAP